MKEIKTNAKFCPYCGNNTAESAGRQATDKSMNEHAANGTKPKKRFPKKLIIILCAAGVLLTAATVFLFLNFQIVVMDGGSMMNTIKNGDKVVITKMFYTPENGDIVVISKGQNYNKPILKRIIASGGQIVKLDYENDKLYVDGVEINEPYIRGSTFGRNTDNHSLPADENGNIQIPEGKFFVLGDNRAISLDSRSDKIGLIDKDDIIGELLFVF